MMLKGIVNAGVFHFTIAYSCCQFCSGLYPTLVVPNCTSESIGG